MISNGSKKSEFVISKRENRGQSNVLFYKLNHIIDQEAGFNGEDLEMKLILYLTSLRGEI